MKANRPGQSALLLLDVIQILHKFKIPYAIIGAFAASFYGVVRASIDADALIHIEDKEAVKGRPFGPPPRLVHSARMRRGTASVPYPAKGGVAPEAVEQLRSAFKKKGLRVDYRRGDPRDPVRAVINIRDIFQNRVDLLTGIRRMKRDVFRRAKKTKFMGCTVNVIGREDFIAMKIFAGGPKDIHDVIGVLDVSGDKINLPLLKNLAAGYGQACTKTLDKLLKSRF